MGIRSMAKTGKIYLQKWNYQKIHTNSLCLFFSIRKYVINIFEFNLLTHNNYLFLTL